jgi:hypothetical protein
MGSHSMPLSGVCLRRIGPADALVITIAIVWKHRAQVILANNYCTILTTNQVTLGTRNWPSTSTLYSAHCCDEFCLNVAVPICDSSPPIFLSSITRGGGVPSNLLHHFLLLVAFVIIKEIIVVLNALSPSHVSVCQCKGMAWDPQEIHPGYEEADTSSSCCRKLHLCTVE